MYLVTLTDDQRVELNRRSHGLALSPSTRDRLEMVRLSDAGWSAPRIAKHLGQHEQTVRFWIKAFLSDGFDALANKPHLGLASALTKEMLSGLRETIAQGERAWTAGQAREWVSAQYGVTLSEGRLRLHMRRSGLSHQRTSRNLKHKQKPDEVAERRVTLKTLEKGGTTD
jgi:transposase